MSATKQSGAMGTYCFYQQTFFHVPVINLPPVEFSLLISTELIKFSVDLTQRAD